MKHKEIINDISDTASIEAKLEDTINAADGHDLNRKLDIAADAFADVVGAAFLDLFGQERVGD